MWFYVPAACVVAADQITKWLALTWLAEQPGRRVALIPGLFDLYLQFNTGGAFSLFHDRPGLILVFALVTVAWMIWYVQRLPSARITERLAFGLIVGGALGNLADRLRLGFVVDFFHVYWRQWYWPTFNVADSAICVGVGLFLYMTFVTSARLAQQQSKASEEHRQSVDDAPQGEINEKSSDER
ncbi:MAG: signal peptidase II [Candidatus Sumerlaeaceae bacterium]|jgi:signal peptidase II